MNYEKSTGFLYNTFWGGVLRLVLKQPIVNKCYGALQRTSGSRRKIPKLIEQYQIDTSEFVARDFESFNDFIIREIKPEARPIGIGLIAPADSHVLAIEAKGDTLLSIKGRDYTISKLIGEKDHDYALCLIFRLAVYDYHHFCFPDRGELLAHKKISGVLDSVNMAATGSFVLTSNVREVSILKTEGFGKMAFVEVGAMLVGRIVNTCNEKYFAKGDKKGYFEFGASTIVMLLEKDAVNLRSDILENSHRGIETRVKAGESLSC